jgi:C-terminal processing protease CtpA/Prc
MAAAWLQVGTIHLAHGQEYKYLKPLLYKYLQVGTIRLASFNARALRDVSAALDQLQQRGATELVLDLRDNRWGANM